MKIVTKEKTCSAFFLALVPHRDVLCKINPIKESLFNSGAFYAYSFPVAVPLAILKTPLKSEALKALAKDARDMASLESQRGFFSTEGGATAHLSHAGLSIFGLCLSKPSREDFLLLFEKHGINENVKTCISPFVLALSLESPVKPSIESSIESPIESSIFQSALPLLKKISFRAAALANMRFSLRPCKSGSSASFFTEWEISALHWLPSIKKAKKA
jgi:hypothetical protein